MRSTTALRLSSVLLLLAHVLPAHADVRMPAVFSSGMVLQQGIPLPIWGQAEPGEKVTVTLDGQSATVSADANGRWRVDLKPIQADGKSRQMIIAGKNRLTLDDLLIGEVWICSGQSNMGAPLAPRPGSKQTVGTANAQIRLFTVPERLSDAPQAELASGTWESCGPDTVGKFSAVAYYFGRELQKSLNVPVGLIHASYGGSPISQWLTPATLEIGDFEALRRRGVKPSLFNGMISPLVSFGIRGVLWYQGEADANDAAAYAKAFPALIRGWRTAWKLGDFPFLYVQIAPYGPIVDAPQESCWAELREVQRQTLSSVPNSAMVITTDVGHESNIHPQPKQPVGERLALAARAQVYGQKIIAFGPQFTTIKVADGKTVLTFDHFGSGLEARELVREDLMKDPRAGKTGGALHLKPRSEGVALPLRGFTIAGEDGAFKPAVAEIHENQVVVWSQEVPKPVAVRYGWADYPVGNLYNREGLPASPFRTDSFPLRGVPRSRE